MVYKNISVLHSLLVLSGLLYYGAYYDIWKGLTYGSVPKQSVHDALGLDFTLKKEHFAFWKSFTGR